MGEGSRYTWHVIGPENHMLLFVNGHIIFLRDLYVIDDFVGPRDYDSDKSYYVKRESNEKYVNHDWHDYTKSWQSRC